MTPSTVERAPLPRGSEASAAAAAASRRSGATASWARVVASAPGPAGPASRRGDRALRVLGSTSATTVICAAALCAIAFAGGGGLELGGVTRVEVGITLVAGAILAAIALLARAPAGERRGRAHGVWAVALLVLFAALTAASVGWSVQPDASWQEAGRMFAYAALFAAAVALARVAPGRWRSVLGGVTLACVVVSGYALLTKVFPGSLDAADTYARLQQPYGYWIATGLTAAMGAIGCLWLGARRDGHGLLRALAYPAVGVELVTLLLTYSRGPLVAFAVGLVVWLCVVPLRLRGAAVLLTGAAGAAGVVAFDFSTHALSTDGAPLAERTSAGGQLGVLLVAMVVALTLAGLAICFWTGRSAPGPRYRRVGGMVLLALPALAILAIVAGLVASRRGPVGTISHAFSTLTDPNAPLPSNAPGRLTTVANVRARYWQEALEIWEANPLVGAGGEGYATARLRYRTETLQVRHAHGFVVQTLADLGLVGLAVMVALLLAWAVAAARPTRPWRMRDPYSAERIAMLSLLAIVVVFGVHSLVDWTWYVPGTACIALLCAGWLAGRGPLAWVKPAGGALAGAEIGGVGAAASRVRPVGPSGRRLAARAAAAGTPRVALAAGILVAAVLAAFTQWQPDRSAGSAERALALIGRDDATALASARAAVSQDPLSAYALRVLADAEQARGQSGAAEATLRRAVRLQPSNPETWAALGEHDLGRGEWRAALAELRAAVYLNPQAVAPEPVIAQSPELLALRDAYLQALRESASATRTAGADRAQRPSALRLRRARLTARQRRQNFSHSRIASP